MRPRTLPLVLALAAGPAHAFQPFQVKDIRVEGIQRTEAGTVFSYLPVKVGETLDADRAAAAIKALYATGFFKDVRLEAQDGVLVVLVEERPAIAQVSFTGMKEFPKDDVLKSLKDLGLAEGRILDQALLERAEQELKRQYYNRGMYAAEVRARLSPLERNRVAVTFEVSEGEVAKIRGIHIIGNKAYSEKELLKLFTLTTPGWLTWFTKNDQYSRQKLAADLEALRSHYLNNGYLDFAIESTQVSITPDKKDIYITINIHEGERFKVAEVKFAGSPTLPEAELRQMVSLKLGEVFSREKLNESIQRIGERLGNDGYAFANVNAAPEVDKDKREVGLTLLLDPGRKVYVRRINISGNTRTRDEVIRREMRQMEGAQYAADKIKRSRERIERLGYFSEVNLETPIVPEATDQVDVNVSVTERPTGNLMLGAGYSSAEGLVLSASVSQNNLWGTGNRLSAQINSGSVNTIYALSFTNPYYTVDGVSLGYDLYRRDVDTDRLRAVSTYSTSTYGAGLRLGLPVSEYDSLQLGAALERLQLDIHTNTPQYIRDNTLALGGNANGLTANTLRLEAGWARDSRDSILFPTKGTLQRVYVETGAPVGDLKYYKLTYQHQWWWPLTQTVSLALNGEIGWGGGYGGKPMPFFRNFFAGGIGSVRGFDSGTLGPQGKDSAGSPFALGGTRRLVGNAELYFPVPGAGKDKNLRLSAFVDAGGVWGPGDYQGRYGKLSLSELRYSGGVAVTWYSPFGPIKLSVAAPFKTQPDDRKQAFQFQLGHVF
ncbi:MAG: outer membrane protein assembly factor BamA [Thiobacillaceae bacterium]|nr:outer membrane protein assembly factor BamA [Thiobacillaceae bacterium]MCX7673973.1 outer membrane protein assembly factor BamA [Thiobacillaceae bacterium]